MNSTLFKANKKPLTEKQKRSAQKVTVYSLLALLFLGSMWLIFSPSNKQEQAYILGSGLNSDLPMPKDNSIVEDKRSAYMQDDLRLKQEAKRQSLDEFSFLLEAAGDEEKNASSKLKLEGLRAEAKAQRGVSAQELNSSAYAYQTVNRQLNSFYNNEQSKQGKAMQQRIAELEQALAQSKDKSTEQESLDMLEKSYQIASKYMAPQEPAQSTRVSSTVAEPTTYSMRKKLEAKPVDKLERKLVSSLAAPLSDEAFIASYGQADRNYGFITANNHKEQARGNAIKACVYRTTTITDGVEVQLRLLQAIRVGSVSIPRNSILTGLTSIGGERLQITVSTILYKDHLLPVKLIVFDNDGIQGLSTPGSEEIAASKELLASMGSSMGSSINITDDAVSQLVADVGRSAIQGVSRYASEKVRQVRITLKANHMLYLVAEQ